MSSPAKENIRENSGPMSGSIEEVASRALATICFAVREMASSVVSSSKAGSIGMHLTFGYATIRFFDLHGIAYKIGDVNSACDGVAKSWKDDGSEGAASTIDRGRRDRSGAPSGRRRSSSTTPASDSPRPAQFRLSKPAEDRRPQQALLVTAPQAAAVDAHCGPTSARCGQGWRELSW